MAARRVVSVSGENKNIGCPTDPNSPSDNKVENPALSNHRKRSSLSNFMRPAHKRMSRMLGYCLTLGTANAWSDFAQVAAIRLTEIERASLAFAMLRSLSPASAELTAGAALGAAGAPLPPFLGGMDEARVWASWASRAELKTHTLAGFEEMSLADQAAFFQHISELEVAA